MGDYFKGVYSRPKSNYHLFDKVAHGSKEIPEIIIPDGDDSIKKYLDLDLLKHTQEELELISEVASEFDLDAIHQGKMTPVFFGSAMTNFGVRLFLESFLEYALPPTPRKSTEGELEPTYPDFSGFVFKLQANMDPKHRDRVAFVRVCTGKFEKDMSVNHARTGKIVRLSRPQKLFAQGRESIEEAYPGDVIGLNNPGVFAIGDTIYLGKKIEYDGIPCFSPELFSYLKNPNHSQFKQFQKGIQQLQEEGAVQIMYSNDDFIRDPILAAVGQLQFEVVQFRLLNEYNVETKLEPIPYNVARWVVVGWEALAKVGRLFNTMTVKDAWNRPVLLFKNEWNVNQVIEDHPNLKLSAIAPLGTNY
jgi:peptide chain release factor 3